MAPETLAVEVKNLTVRFGDFIAVNNITFSVTKGEIFGFLGANGAGKTTTIRVLCGLLVPNEGEIHVGGEDFSAGGKKVKEKVGYMSQKFTLYDDLTVAENLLFTSQLRKIPQNIFEKRKKELLDFIGFKRELDVLVKDLPGGLKQQVSLAASMLHDPEIVFLDEPTAGVTPAARARFWDLIQSVAKKGKTVFVTTHYMDEAEQCGRVALLRAGELIALDSPSRLKEKSFPQGLLELEPLNTITGQDIAELHESKIFSLLEPYGMRYHAEIADHATWEKFRPQLEKKFSVHPIPPSLEDVFIRLVEGTKR